MEERSVQGRNQKPVALETMEGAREASSGGRQKGPLDDRADWVWQRWRRELSQVKRIKESF